MGFSTALDDYGSGYSRFNLLIETQPQYLKLDMSLIRDVHEVPEKQALIDGTCLSMRRLGIDVIAEGSKPSRSTSGCVSMASGISRASCSPGPASSVYPNPFSRTD